MAGLEQNMRRINDTVTPHKAVQHWCHLTALHLHADGPRVQRLNNDEHQVTTRYRTMGVVGILWALLGKKTVQLVSFLFGKGVIVIERVIQSIDTVWYQPVLHVIAPVAEVVQVTFLVVLIDIAVTHNCRQQAGKQCKEERFRTPCTFLMTTDPSAHHTSTHEQQERHHNQQVVPSQQRYCAVHQRGVEVTGQGKALPRHQIIVSAAITQLHQAPQGEQRQGNPHQPTPATAQQPVGRQEQ